MLLSNDNVTEGIVPVTEKMIINERFKYSRSGQQPYMKAKRRERGRVLEEMA